MKEIYLLRHAEAGSDRPLSIAGQVSAERLAHELPVFTLIYASHAPRTQDTARFITGKEPVVDEAAGFDEIAANHAADISKLAIERGIPFIQALNEYQDGALLGGIATQATLLNDFIDRTFTNLGPDEKALIVTHDLSISPAMMQRGLPPSSVENLAGYVISEMGEPRSFEPA